MRQHRLLVSGANGFVGSALANLVRGHPKATDIEFATLAKISGETIDIRDVAAVERVVADFHPTAIIHLAAVASPRAAQLNPHEAWAVNVIGTFNLAHATLKHAPEARFIFAGSSEVYGASFARVEGPIGESSPLEPLTSYGATKAASELMLSQMSHQGLKAVKFRPFNHTGPGQSALYVVSFFAQQIVRIERGWQDPVIRVGNLKAQRDFLDVRDVAQAYLSAALLPERSDHMGAFNLCTGRPMTIGSVLEILLAHSSVPISINRDPKLLRPDEIEIHSGDPEKTAEIWGWRPRIPIEQTLRDVIEYWRKL